MSMDYIGNILIELGITPDLKSFGYLKRAVEIIQSYPIGEKPKVCEVYESVGKEFGVSWQSAERSIRYALSKMDRNTDAFQRHIGIDSTKTGTLLFTLAYRTKQEKGASER